MAIYKTITFVPVILTFTMYAPIFFYPYYNHFIAVAI
jgi:hypothetical protein